MCIRALENLQGIYRTAPTAPYRIVVALLPPVNPVNYATSEIGWSDGTKFLVAGISNQGTQAKLIVQQFSNTTSLSSQPVNYTASNLVNPAGPVWIALDDDGTTVSFMVSSDSYHWRPIFTQTKSGGWLSAYNQVLFLVNGVVPSTDKTTGTIICWDENGLSRTLASIYDN